jgi:hypothetical protein
MGRGDEADATLEAYRNTGVSSADADRTPETNQTICFFKMSVAILAQAWKQCVAWQVFSSE